ncbi:hypothetical protein H8959_001625 [Pygathrix nigripes]
MDPLRRSPSPCLSSRPSSPSTPPCEMLGPVGIEAVLDQLKIKAMKMGFEFNIMVVVIEEKGVKLKLTVTDTPGFGDQINNDNWVSSECGGREDAGPDRSFDFAARASAGVCAADLGTAHPPPEG